MAIFSDISILRILLDIFPENSKLIDLVTLWDGDGYKILPCAYYLSTDIFSVMAMRRCGLLNIF